MPETVTKTKATESPVSVADTSDASHMAASDERAALERDLMSTWRDLFGLLQSQAAPKWANLDVSMAQIKTLITLSDVRTATIGEIAAKLGIGLPTASHLVEKLVQLGLVERAEDPEDRRRAIARLTAKGDELVRQLRGQTGNRPAAVFGVFRPLHQPKLHQLLHQMTGGWQADTQLRSDFTDGCGAYI